MTDLDLGTFLDAARISPDIARLRTDYRVLLIAADGIEPGPSDAASDALLTKAEDSARAALADTQVTEISHVSSWREAYRAFGAKPQKTRNSLEALLRRTSKELPRVNRLTDIYNAVSVLHQLPLGGEDLTRYQGSPQLIRATGEEPFDTVAGGEPVTEHPEPGEVVWTDDAGVTCRRWNWRQGRRTGLTDSTTAAVFILDALDPFSDDDLHSAADDLAAHLTALGSHVQVAQRVISAGRE